MIPAIKSEFRKLFTVRSTYFIVIISLLLVVFAAGYVEGYKNAAQLYQVPNLLEGESKNALTFVGFILAFAGLLLAGHEYRYNTIMYTLTSANRRTKVFVAKFIAISVFALSLALFVTFFSPLMTIVGMKLAGYTVGPQEYHLWSTLGRCLFVGWGYAMYAFILMMLLRNQIGAIVTFLLIPLIGEGLLTLLLKENVIYLPFTALQSVASNEIVQNSTASLQSIILTVSAYIGAGLIVSLLLFIKRDAN